MDFGSDVVLATEGAAFSQIISMYNWWQMVSGTPGQSVNSIQGFTSGVDTLPSNAVHVLGQYYYLVPDSAVATGVPGSSGPVPILSLDTDAKLNVTGHSLGGHLAVAFKMLFSDVVDKGFTYNSPGIGINADTQAFFSALDGGVLSNTPENFQHVIGSEVADGDPFYATAGLHLTEAERAAAIHVAIEDQVPGESFPLPWDNHSIVVLTDALAVYSLLTELDPTLSADDFHEIFQQSSNQTFDSLENIVSSIASLFGVSGTALVPGNDHRNDLYLKIADIRADTGFQQAAAQNSGFAFFREGNTAETAKSDFGHFFALEHLTPFVFTANDEFLQQLDPALYEAWSHREFSNAYLQDRSMFRHAILQANTADTEHPHEINGQKVMFFDVDAGEVFAGQNTLLSIDKEDVVNVIFGNDSANAPITGYERNDWMYRGFSEGSPQSLAA